MRIAYFDGASGASGDMLLGALVGAGLEIEALRAELTKLPLEGYDVAAEPAVRARIAGMKVTVRAAGEQPARRLADIRAMVDGAALPEADRDAIMRIFSALAEAEGDVHGVPPQDVHFHEVGAIDSIVDIAGTVIGLRLLEVERVYCAPLVTGRGEVRSEHGLLPVPAPGTLRLLERAGAPIASSRDEPPFEALTPTAAAILTTLATFGRPAMRLLRTGYGAGTRDDPARPNMLRLWLGEAADQPAVGPSRLLLFECNIDDMNPELYDWAREQLVVAGAVDVWFTAIQMKKNRPGTLLSALAPPTCEGAVANVFLRETSTLGVRVREVWRHEAERRSFTFASSLGEARAKARILPDGGVAAAPEYESCRALAEANGLPLIDVYRRLSAEAQAEAEGQFSGGLACLGAV
jgi:uncharacterized protein (TIGR00299 family) protein